MRALLQRVSQARVSVDAEVVAEIRSGLLIFLGVAQGDSEAEASWLVDKALGLRIFADDEKAMNRSVLDVGGEVLVVSQFTLAADVSRGKRPSFTTAADPENARALYDFFVAQMRVKARVSEGRFGADMQVELTNDGPVTFLLDRQPPTTLPESSGALS